MEENEEFAGIVPGIMGLVLVITVFTLIQTLSAPSVPPTGTAIVYGFVTDADTGDPIPDATVTLNGLVRYTAWVGQYEIRDIAAGLTYSMTFSHADYQTVTLDVTPSEGLNEVNVQMESIY